MPLAGRLLIRSNHSSTWAVQQAPSFGHGGILWSQPHQIIWGGWGERDPGSKGSAAAGRSHSDAFWGGSSLGEKVLMGKNGKCREAELKGGVLQPPGCPQGTQPGWGACGATLPSPRPSPVGARLPKQAGHQSTEPRHARQELGTAAAERSPKAPGPFPSNAAPRGGEAGFSSGAMPRNRPLLLEAGAGCPGCVTLAPSSSGRSMLPAETRLDQALSVPARFKGLFWGFLQLVV